MLTWLQVQDVQVDADIVTCLLMEQKPKFVISNVRSKLHRVSYIITHILQIYKIFFFIFDLYIFLRIGPKIYFRNWQQQTRQHSINSF